MSEPQRQHPVAAITKALDIIRGNFITILILIFIGGGDQAVFTLYWILGTIVALLVWGVISWLRFSFQVEEGELRIEQGVLIRKKLYLTSDRIQVIDISAGIVQRLFGLVAVEVKTAGSSSKEAKISALTQSKAEELKEKLRHGQAPQAVQEAEDEEEKKFVKKYTLDTKDLLIAATTSGRMGVALSVVGAIFSQIDQLISEEQMYQLIETHIPRSTSLSLVIMSAIAILVVAWMLSFVSTIIAYYDFEVEVRDNELLIGRGLFERTQLTIPFNRIQAVQVKEELMRQPLGYVSLVIESAGYGDSQGNSATLFPLIKKGDMYTFLEEVIPEYNYTINDGYQRVPRRALRRYLLRMLWWTLPVILLAWGTVPYGYYAWLLLVPAMLLGYQQYRDAGIRNEDGTLVLSSRLLSKKTAIVKKYRTQATIIKQNPFQRRLNLHDFTVHVASGNQGRSFGVRDLADDTVYEFWQWMEVSEKVSTDPQKNNENGYMPPIEG
ncbi:PH domain-containing protein [Fodinibius salsisoli]|uniref:PH domain-containing protein n=1 Tax=Fodinibius salsisoli TaxID=2820877 RepID=A0ABT3PRZ7_9BACT|nr:PH domain-containing protein [Fodinibius salsisoli]MCW9708637.1 PH domain-containing protein [Fodinibius salsisoli]